MNKRLVINYHLTDDPTVADFLTGFPMYDDQEDVTSDYGDAGIVEIDLGNHSDTTRAQEQWLDTNPRVIGYSIEDGDLHDEH